MSILKSTRKSAWLAPSLCGGAAAYLYINLFVSSNVPILLGGDQVYFWMDAQRMLHGELPYRDFFQFTPPGTDLVYFILFRLFGPHIWVTNVVVLALGVALCGICFSIASQIMEFELALPATVLFLTLIYTRLLNATHHWFSVLVILCALRVLLRSQSRGRMFFAGSLLGLAGFFSQSHAGAALLAMMLWLGWQHFRDPVRWLTDVAVLVFGFAITLGIAESYFIVVIGWKLLWYFQVTYVLHFMVSGPGTSFLGMPPWNGWRHFPSTAQYVAVYLLLPIVYVVTLWKCWKGSSEPLVREQDQKAFLVALTGSVLLFEVTFSLNWLRIYTISLPGIILLLWLVRSFKGRRTALQIIWVAIIFIAATEIVHAHHRFVVAELPAGPAATDFEDYQKLQWIKEHTQPEELFFESAWPGVYMPLRLRNPVYAEGVGLDTETRPEFVLQAITQLDEKKVRYILWSRQLNLHGDPEPATSSLAPLRVYLHEHYKKVEVFADQDEIWERK
jgi:hypothetical protein